MYFLLAGSVDLFRYLHYGLAAILAFVGAEDAGRVLAGTPGHGAAAHLGVAGGRRVLLAISIVGVDRGASEREREEG